jgi:hypothetical protein
MSSTTDLEEVQEWSVWYDESHQQTLDMEQFDELALEVGRVNSYDEMRKIWASIVHNTGKPQTWSNTRVFRSSILPHDQDPENVNGGQSILRLSVKDWNVCFWLNLLACVFDGHLSFSEHLTGMVLSCRPTGFLISLWHDDQLTASQIDTLSSELRLLFDCQEVTHRVHREVQQRRQVDRLKRKHHLKAYGRKKAVDVDQALKSLETKYSRSTTAEPTRLQFCDVFNVLGMLLITLVVTLLRWIPQSAMKLPAVLSSFGNGSGNLMINTTTSDPQAIGLLKAVCASAGASS